ncbi:diguanylate cyclase domain-containing protein [Moritella sp. Urea-trap-13]|uniref:diguanylate cyclase domain-containing protein n=1 Tax=Moritella sp. Urea-trap-13 TaxID=2058327 RepID=UPI000C34BD62|nr:diguanylate cyclase [Moritella sp. Urea-trap-13]PKH04956.1 GGDEF domain-containing protein [Moritella sp. Urea-trap-13]
MSADQTYYLTIALINIILAFAGTRINDTEGKTQSIPFLIGSFLAFAISWFLYSLELNIFIEVTSTILSTVFVWGITVFSFKRCEVKTPWRLISCLFLANITIQTFFTIEHNINYVLHTASIFTPIAFCLSGHLFLKKKADRSPSDIIVAYAYFSLTAVVITRSILLETSSALFSLTMASSQIIWPIFSVILGVFFLLSFTEEAQKKLTTEVITDTLTGLFNRRMFDEQFKRLLPTLSRDKHFGALIYLDLDGFKSVNDEYGHNIGDKVLLEFGSRLNQSSRGKEVIARIGGDEFVLLVENAGQDRTTAHQSALGLAQRIQSLMKEPINIDGLMLQIDCSIGIHILTPDAKNVPLEVKAADAAMYQAKKDQHHRIVFSDNLNKPRYNILNIGIVEIDREHQNIDNLLNSLLEKKTDLTTGFPFLIKMVDLHFKNEVKISKRLRLNFSKEHHLHHTYLLDSLKKIGLKESEHVIREHLLMFIKLLEEHIKKYDRNLNIEVVEIKKMG